MQYIFCHLRQTKNACTNFHVLSVVLGAGIVAGASYSADVAVFEPGAKHTFDEGVGKILKLSNSTFAFWAYKKEIQQ